MRPTASPSGKHERTAYYNKSWALVVGINDYGGRHPTLANARNDAVAVAELLKRDYQFEEVITLYDAEATHDTLMAWLRDQLAAQVGPEDRVIFFFAGHGTTRESTRSEKRGYLIPYDAATGRFADYIDMFELRDACGWLQAKHILLILDCCFSGIAAVSARSTPAAAMPTLTDAYLKRITERGAWQVLAAGAADELAADSGDWPGHSAFTGALLAGLRGQADQNADGIITASELANYLKPVVSRSTDRGRGGGQTPFFNYLAGSDQGDFVFLRPDSVPRLEPTPPLIPQLPPLLDRLGWNRTQVILSIIAVALVGLLSWRFWPATPAASGQPTATAISQSTSPTAPSMPTTAVAQVTTMATAASPTATGAAPPTATAGPAFLPTPFVEFTQPAPCGEAATPIHDLHGSDGRSPLYGQAVTVEGVVTGDFQETRQLNGFFLQSTDSAADNDPATSEGVFIYAPKLQTDVHPFDLVRVTGMVSTFTYTFTQLKEIADVRVCGRGAVTPTAVRLPVEDWSRYQAMLLHFPQTLVASDIYDLDRYGQIHLSWPGRLFAPTMIQEPGAAAVAQQQTDDQRYLYVDDGSNSQNPATIPYLHDGLLRLGDEVADLTGVLWFAYPMFSEQVRHVLHPVLPVRFRESNPRPAAPEALGGTTKVAIMNMQNFFVTLADGSVDDSAARGAGSSTELARQRAKLLAALFTLDADITGLLELENESAVQAILVSHLNEQAGRNAYQYIADPVVGLGTDQIKVGLIYKRGVVEPVGPAVTLLAPPFDQLHSPPLAQTFRSVANGAEVTVVIVRFKSKGGGIDAPAENADQGDGQGLYNGARVAAAQALTAWLATNPTGSQDSDILVLGDLNAYAKEDPIDVFTAAGYRELLFTFVHELQRYTYNFDGRSGYLNYMLTSRSLTPQVHDVTIWHINADEPKFFDYTEDFKSAGIISLLRPDPYRSSDHDPIIVSFDLTK